MFDSMGLGKDASYAMATGLVQLANDMASFRNIKPELAFDILQGAMTGNTRGLKQLGIVIDDTTLKTLAYKAGIAKQGEELSSQQKVIATYLALIERTATDQGSLANNSESTTNKMRRLKDEFAQNAVTVGKDLLPAYNRFVLGPAAALMDWVSRRRKR